VVDIAIDWIKNTVLPVVMEDHQKFEVMLGKLTMLEG
jgi:hypothetical protein